MSERVEPALTPEEWADHWRLVHPAHADPAYAHRRMAEFNAALPDGHPGKLTGDTVAKLRELAAWHAEHGGSVVAEWITGHADAVAALLPPT